MKSGTQAPSNKSFFLSRDEVTNTITPATGSSKLISAILQGFVLLGILGSYLFYGYIQEFLSLKHFSKTPLEDNSDVFDMTGILILAQNIGTIFVAIIMTKILRQPTFTGLTANFPYKIGLAVSYLSAMFLSNKAIMFIDYTSQVLIKTCKLLPVLLMNFLFSSKSKRATKSTAICVIIMTGAVLVFTIIKLGKRATVLSGSAPAVGLTLLVLSLAADGGTGAFQDILLSKDARPINLMMASNIIAAVIMFFAELFSGELFKMIKFFSLYPEAIFYVCFFCLVGALGQLFIYLALNFFGSVSVSIVTTTRKFISIILSVVLFGHSLTIVQWICCFLVFFAVFFDMYEKQKRKKGTQNKEEVKEESKTDEAAAKKEN